MKSFVLTAIAAVALCLVAAAANAANPFDALIDGKAPITLAANTPVTKLPAGGLFGSLLAPTKTAECQCENCTCANCGCSVETASEEEVVAAARLADQQRYIYTVAADGSFTAVPRRAASTGYYQETIVRSDPVCINGSCAIPSGSYSSGYSYSSQQRSYSSGGGQAYTGRGSYGGPFRRLFGGGRFRSCGPGGCN